MRTDLFDFELPDELIALHPVTPRDAARLLVVAADGLHDRSVRDLPHLLRAGDVLVCNNTRVIPAALEGVRERGEARARIAVNLHRRVASNRWRAFARPARKLEPGERVRFGSGNTSCLMGALDATVVAKSDGGEVELAFDLDGAALDAAVAGIGAMPLPPYIAARRPAGRPILPIIRRSMRSAKARSRHRRRDCILPIACSPTSRPPGLIVRN